MNLRAGKKLCLTMRLLERRIVNAATGKNNRPIIFQGSVPSATYSMNGRSLSLHICRWILAAAVMRKTGRQPTFLAIAPPVMCQVSGRGLLLTIRRLKTVCSAMNPGVRQIILRGTAAFAICRVLLRMRLSTMKAWMIVSPAIQRIGRPDILSGSVPSVTVPRHGRTRYSATPFRGIMAGRIRMFAEPAMPRGWGAILASLVMMPAGSTGSTGMRG